ncbi:hypothetical protein FHS32_001166 [Streptomyces albaduncus]|uniref:Uncharacterized protein n=1 Tax=Streptomyces griseoloalbus TaxID=67303 RepID=A0A7W8BM56_9ACTN|nr:hypothetical protein [Streptomyces albaduncus]GGW64039.1 hypothetical protein GCM10010340_47920 [Streptomyces albaduncus]
MITNPSAELLDNLLTVAGQTTAVREEVRVWSMSGVERVTFPDGLTAIFKYAKKPLDSEDQALRLAHTLGVPVTQVHASTVLDGWLGMLMDDVGPSVREADDLDGVAAAVVLLPAIARRLTPGRVLVFSVPHPQRAGRCPSGDDRPRRDFVTLADRTRLPITLGVLHGPVGEAPQPGGLLAHLSPGVPRPPNGPLAPPPC